MGKLALFVLFAAAGGALLRGRDDSNIEHQLRLFGSARVRAASPEVVQKLVELLKNGASAEKMIGAMRDELPGGEEMKLDEFKGALIEIGEISRMEKKQESMKDVYGIGGQDVFSLIAKALDPLKAKPEGAVGEAEKEDSNLKSWLSIGGTARDEESHENDAKQWISIGGTARDDEQNEKDAKQWISIGGTARNQKPHEKNDEKDWISIGGTARDDEQNEKDAKQWISIGGTARNQEPHEKDNAKQPISNARTTENGEDIGLDDILNIADKNLRREVFIKTLSHDQPLTLLEVDKLIDSLPSKAPPSFDEVLAISDARERLRAFASLVPHNHPMSFGEVGILMDLVSQDRKHTATRENRKLWTKPSDDAEESDLKRRSKFAAALPHEVPLTNTQIDALMDAYRERTTNPEDERKQFANSVRHSDIIFNLDWDTFMQRKPTKSRVDLKHEAGLKAIDDLTATLTNLGIAAKRPTKDESIKLISEISKIDDVGLQRRTFVETFPHAEPLTFSQIDALIAGNAQPRTGVTGLDEILKIEDMATRRRALANLAEHDAVVSNEVWDKFANEIKNWN